MLSGDAKFWPCNRPKDKDKTLKPYQCYCSDEEVRQAITRAKTESSLNEKVYFLVELDRFDRERPIAEAKRTTYRQFQLHQPYWAGKYDPARARKPLADDSAIFFPGDLPLVYNAQTCELTTVPAFFQRLDPVRQISVQVQKGDEVRGGTRLGAIDWDGIGSQDPSHPKHRQAARERSGRWRLHPNLQP